MEVFVVTDTDHTVEDEEILDLVRKAGGDDSEHSDLALVTGSEGDYRSVLDWAAATCRAKHKLVRKLVLELEDQGAVYKVLLQAANRDLTGDSDFVVSDLLEVEGRIKKARNESKWPEKGEGVVGEAVGRYKGFLKQCGLADRWEVVKELVSSVEGEKKGLVVVGLGEEKELVKIVSGGMVMPLSLQHGAVVVGEKTSLDTLLVGVGVGRKDMGYESLGIVASFLRLLVCSKDELSLARVVTVSKLLTNQQFTQVRREAEVVKMSMYQSIVSFVRKVGLSQANQPEEENTMYGMLDSLVEFNRIMEKLQDKMEETSGAVPAVMAVVSALRNWLVKQGVEVDRDLMEKVEKLSGEVERRLASLHATPARGLMGRPAVKLMTGLVDLLASAGQEQTKLVVGKTPARQARLVESFKTPQPDIVLDPGDEMDCLLQDQSLSDRLGGVEAHTVTTPLARPAFPRFKTSNDFTEGSPALLGSGNRGGVITGGSTLMARAGESPGGSPCTSVENTRRILHEVKEKEELEYREQMENVKEGIKKTKRCLAKEVDSLVRDKMGLKRKKDDVEDKAKENKSKQPPKKKKFSTPKGQKKMTSFFTR